MIETNVPGAPNLPICCRAVTHLHRHYGAREEAGQNNDGNAADANRVHLQENVVDVVGFSREIQHGPAGQFVELLNRLDGALQNIKHVYEVMLAYKH